MDLDEFSHKKSNNSKFFSEIKQAGKFNLPDISHRSHVYNVDSSVSS